MGSESTADTPFYTPSILQRGLPEVISAYRRIFATMSKGKVRPPIGKIRCASVYEGEKYRPFLLNDPYNPIDADPPHERDPIALQMGKPERGVFPMNGFVANYATAKGAKPPQPTIVGDGRSAAA